MISRDSAISGTIKEVFHSPGDAEYGSSPHSLKWYAAWLSPELRPARAAGVAWLSLSDQTGGSRQVLFYYSHYRKMDP